MCIHLTTEPAPKMQVLSSPIVTRPEMPHMCQPCPKSPSGAAMCWQVILSSLSFNYTADGRSALSFDRCRRTSLKDIFKWILLPRMRRFFFLPVPIDLLSVPYESSLKWDRSSQDCVLEWQHNAGGTQTAKGWLLHVFSDTCLVGWVKK